MFYADKQDARECLRKGWHEFVPAEYHEECDAAAPKRTYRFEYVGTCRIDVEASSQEEAQRKVHDIPLNWWIDSESCRELPATTEEEKAQ